MGTSKKASPAPVAPPPPPEVEIVDEPQHEDHGYGGIRRGRGAPRGSGRGGRGGHQTHGTEQSHGHTSGSQRGGRGGRGGHGAAQHGDSRGENHRGGRDSRGGPSRGHSSPSPGSSAREHAVPDQVPAATQPNREAARPAQAQAARQAQPNRGGHRERKPAAAPAYTPKESTPVAASSSPVEQQTFTSVNVPTSAPRNEYRGGRGGRGGGRRGTPSDRAEPSGTTVNLMDHVIIHKKKPKKAGTQVQQVEEEVWETYNPEDLKDVI